MPDGVWVAGEFTQVGTQRRDSLARLSTNPAPGYSGWAEAVFRATPPTPSEQVETADPDQDGVPNVLEYATGTDPLFPDASGSQLRVLSRQPLIFSIARNPDAEVSGSVEAATGLDDWHPLAAEAIQMTVSDHEITVAVKFPVAGRFFRIRFKP